MAQGIVTSESILKINAGPFGKLSKYFEEPQPAVIPFIGAGMSMDSGFPSWIEFLQDLAKKNGLYEVVSTFINEGKFEDAASAISSSLAEDPKDTEIPFWRLVEEGFGNDSNMEKYNNISGAVTLLPQLFTGPLISTNVDLVLERVYKDVNSKITTVIGAEMVNNLEMIQLRNQFLWKIHGDADQQEGLILTKEAFDRAYGVEDLSDPSQYRLFNLLMNVLRSNVILFLGCSLHFDRICRVLKAAKKNEIPREHLYAVVKKPLGEEDIHKREMELASYRITPIWYKPDQHNEIEELLQELIQVKRDSDSEKSQRMPNRSHRTINKRETGQLIFNTKQRSRVESTEITQIMLPRMLHLHDYEEIRVRLRKLEVKYMDNGVELTSGSNLETYMDCFHRLLDFMFSCEPYSKTLKVLGCNSKLRSRIRIDAYDSLAPGSFILPRDHFTKNECTKIHELWYDELGDTVHQSGNEFHFAITKLGMKYPDENNHGALSRHEAVFDGKMIKVPGRLAVFSVADELCKPSQIKILGINEKDKAVINWYCSLRTGVFFLRNLFRALVGEYGYHLHSKKEPGLSECFMANPGSIGGQAYMWLTRRSGLQYSFCQDCIEAWNEADVADTKEKKSDLWFQLNYAGLILRNLMFFGKKLLT